MNDTTATQHAQAAVALATTQLRNVTIAETTTPGYHAHIGAARGHVTVTVLDDTTIASSNYDERGVRQARVTFGVHGPAADIAARLVAAVHAVA